MYARTAYDHSHKAQQYRNERREGKAKIEGNARQQRRREVARELAQLEG